MDLLTNTGLRRTPQRLAIAGFLEGNRDHPTAEDVLAAVRHDHPTISCATVYRTLGALQERGRIRELTIDPRRRRYDPDTGPHHHLLCVGCGKVTDIRDGCELRLAAAIENEYLVLESRVEIHGLCRSCRRAESGGRPSAEASADGRSRRHRNEGGER